jgi:hypothetical protein
VSFLLIVVEGNEGPALAPPETGERGEGLEGDDGGLSTRRRGEGGDVTAARVGERDRSLAVWGKFARRRSRIPKFLLWQFLL